MSLPSSYAMSGTELPHAPTLVLRDARYWATRRPELIYRMLLRWCYAISGTDLPYDATLVLRDVRYARATRCPVLSYGMLLPGEFAAQYVESGGLAKKLLHSLLDTTNRLDPRP
eukprot:3934158-Rhodomonas_salina.2